MADGRQAVRFSIWWQKNQGMEITPGRLSSLPQFLDDGGTEQKVEKLNTENYCETQGCDNCLKARKVSASAAPIQKERRETDRDPLQARNNPVDWRTNNPYPL
jgi:hypothetical protein